MKTKFTLILALMLSLYSVAQQGINYKALIKDGSGTVVANQSITVQFSIYEGVALTTMVYQETHTSTTDGNGIIVINIGEGTIDSGTFTTINWGNDAHYLNTQIDTGSGLVDMGTTEFKTVPYALNAANVTGLEALDEGNGLGWRLKGGNPENYLGVGFKAVDLSSNDSSNPAGGASGNFSTAMGFATTASGNQSTAMGLATTASGGNSRAMGFQTTSSGNTSTAMGSQTTASGFVSTAMGISTTASGDFSTAMGASTIASENYSTAMGISTRASGDRSTAMGAGTTALGVLSTAMGFFTTAASLNSTAVGRYNIGNGDSGSWVDTDPLFEIGNGTSITDKSNALTVLKNGKVGIGTVTPFTPLQIEGGSDANLTNATSGYLIIGKLTGNNLVFDNNEIMARNIVQNTSTLFLQHNGGNISVGGAVVHSSDRRLKRDIQPIPYGLQTILELQPKSYYWKSRPDQKQRSLGLIAQEVQPIINELVLNNEKDDMLSVNYTELIPILIKAIQDQQEIIDNQNSKIEGLTTEVTELKSMNIRIKALEQQLKTAEQ